MVPFISTPGGQNRRRLSGAFRCALLAVLSTIALAAQAQPAASPAQPDPLDPKAAVPALAYESSFAQYRRLGDEKALSWREANDTVARIGGWRVYAREAQQPEAVPPGKSTTAPAAPKAADAPKPMPSGRAHDGHKTP